LVVRCVGCVNYSNLLFFEYPADGSRKLLRDVADYH